MPLGRDWRFGKFDSWRVEDWDLAKLNDRASSQWLPVDPAVGAGTGAGLKIGCA